MYVLQRTEASIAKAYCPKMLYTLLTSNRDALISRCKAKVAKRFAPEEIPAGVDHGVPLFLDQLVDTLRLERNTTARPVSTPAPTPAATKIGRAAALHGSEMLLRGYSVDQVVHDYGDVCQSVTELAVEQSVLVTADEFRTLNRCLDDAIADAVTAFTKGGHASTISQTETLNNRLDAFSDQQLRLLDLAIQSFSAIQMGSIGPGGATGVALKNSLLALRGLITQTGSEKSPASATATLPAKARHRGQRRTKSSVT